MTKKIHNKERCDMLLTVFEQKTPKIPTFFSRENFRCSNVKQNFAQTLVP